METCFNYNTVKNTGNTGSVSILVIIRSTRPNAGSTSRFTYHKREPHGKKVTQFTEY